MAKTKKKEWHRVPVKRADYRLELHFSDAEISYIRQEMLRMFVERPDLFPWYGSETPKLKPFLEGFIQYSFGLYDGKNRITGNDLLPQAPGG